VGITDRATCDVCQGTAVVEYGSKKRRRFCFSHMPHLVLGLAMLSTPGAMTLREEVCMKVNVQEWLRQERQILLAANAR
jgi:hypothetical protein